MRIETSFWLQSDYQRAGDRTTQNHVAFTDSERFVGDTTYTQTAIIKPRTKRTVFDAKRLICRRFDDTTVKNAFQHKQR